MIHYKIINLDSFTNENSREHNEKWPFIPDHLDRILTVGGSGSGETNALLNLIKEQDDIDEIYLYAKDLSEPKDEFLIKKHENTGIKHLNDPNALLNVQIQWITFIKILMITTQVEKEKF